MAGKHVFNPLITISFNEYVFDCPVGIEFTLTMQTILTSKTFNIICDNNMEKVLLKFIQYFSFLLLFYDNFKMSYGHPAL